MLMTPQGRPVLLVEDTPSLSHIYETVLKNAGHDVTCAFTAADARARHAGARSRIVLLDLMLPDGDGLDVLREMKAADPGGKVIVITANGSINRAVDAMRGGAFDFLVKPFDDRRLLSAVENAIAACVREDDEAPRRRTTGDDEAPRDDGFIGVSEPMRHVYEMIRDIGPSTATVFITGESGAGKEVAAQAIHESSGRAQGPFVPLNCGAIPAGLLESEVFGHLRGSFTGAISDKPGAAAVADGGTLFLDEICEMDLALQTKLLRFLQTSMISPVGASKPRKVDVRIICATNRDPAEEVRAGRFREDLFYRLHVVPIHIPPLRERGDDAALIADAFLKRFSVEEGKRFRRLDAETRRLFSTLRWPGNVRQLQNVVRNIVVLNDAEEVTLDMLPLGLVTEEQAPPEAATPPTLTPGAPVAADLGALVAPLVGRTMAEIEREVIEATIEACGGSTPKAARLLDLSPSTIYRKLDAWAQSR